jgi:hypothetical protein
VNGFDAALPFIIALGGGAGLGAGLKALVDTIIAVRAGVSAREGKRRSDIVQQRDEAIRDAVTERRRAAAADLRADDAIARADWAESNLAIARANEQKAREHAAELRLDLMTVRDHPMRRNELPEWPEMDETVPRAKLLEMLEQRRDKES